MLTTGQIERRTAPFWRGLNDHSDSWTENQLVAAGRGKPVPAPDAIPEEEPKANPAVNPENGVSDSNLNILTVPISSRSQSFNSDTSSNVSPSQTTFLPGSCTSSQSGAATIRGRGKTLATLTTSNKNPQSDAMPREMQLPKDPFVSGQPIEAYLYKDALECPICFLYYPPYLNRTRCCDQAICSECFVQIKRPDPHPPEHADPTAPPPPAAEQDIDPEELISEPAACPFCVQLEFGITYDPPPFRRGLTYLNHPSTHPLANAPSAMSSASSLSSAQSGRLSPTGSSRRRATSLSATSPTVITTDKVRPDWHQKLAAARAHTARRSAAATALHTAAYLMGNRQEQDGRTLGGFGRRGILRRTSGADGPSGTNSSQLNMLALMSERYAAANASRAEDGEPTMTPGPRGSSRRNRVDDLEEMMMMEAIRLSLASEEDRRRREDKGSKKDAKKKDKLNKKAEKAARKAGVYLSSANQSTSGVDRPFAEASTSQGDLILSAGKGKAIQQDPSHGNFMPTAAEDPQEHLERARAQILPTDAAMNTSYSPSPYRPSHLRTLSNASSTASSIEGSKPASLTTDHHGQSSSFDVSPSASGVNIPSPGSTQTTYISGTPPGGGAGMEPMFNFRSLAAMVGDDDKSQEITHEEDANQHDSHEHRRGGSAASASTQADLEDRDIRSDHIANGSVVNQGGSASHGLPDFKITSSSRVNSDLEKANEERKHAVIGVEDASP